MAHIFRPEFITSTSPQEFEQELVQAYNYRPGIKPDVQLSTTSTYDPLTNDIVTTYSAILTW